MPRAALLNTAYALFHVPDLVRYGSKPSREIARDPTRLDAIRAHLRHFEEVRGYPPHQVFIGNLSPDALAGRPRPWYSDPLLSAALTGPFGDILDERAFYERLDRADAFDLVRRDGQPGPTGGVSLCLGGETVGSVAAGYPGDDSQTAQLMLENLACKATAVEAAERCLRGVDASSVDFVLNTGEEAIGDRYQRGGGNLAKAVAEACGCTNATGADIKAFCCAPAHALVIAAALIEAGLHQRVLVVGGGSLAKLGMKFEGHLKHDMPVLEDVLGAMAFLLGPEDGVSPTINLRAVGKHPVSAGSTPQAIYGALIAEPLRRARLRFEDVDKYAVELHDPDVTEPQGSGNVPLLNYRAIAALAVLEGQLQAADMPTFVARHGMPGFAPTQGHIPSGVPFLGHARGAMLAGTMRRSMIVAKGSLFLGRMTRLSDGVSFLLEAAACA
ncbi:MAG: glycine/sarcosine/betaine reductase complex component C subunit beta [Chloroflexota bacterium]